MMVVIRRTDEAQDLDRKGAGLGYDCYRWYFIQAEQDDSDLWRRRLLHLWKPGQQGGYNDATTDFSTFHNACAFSIIFSVSLKGLHIGDVASSRANFNRIPLILHLTI